ncbi:unnamed protein product [Symbiodinium sp. CCMP2456]|nr:unnamed protein product [Symbiodinium sp. CCMP2456]
MVLDEQFIQKCREAFNTFDQDGSGTIDTQEMKLLLEAIGEAPSEEELFRFMADVDEDGTGEIEFAEFLRAFEKQRGGAQELEDELDTIDAFVALGGEPDKTGYIDTQRLIQVVKARTAYGLQMKKKKKKMMMMMRWLMKHERMQICLLNAGGELCNFAMLHAGLQQSTVLPVEAELHKQGMISSSCHLTRR